MLVKESPSQFECVYLNTLRFPGASPKGAAEEARGL
jgi:hypothetical protein